MSAKHVIEIHRDGDTDRSYWECDCGAAGSAATDRVDIAAEKHVGEGEGVTYRYRGCAVSEEQERTEEWAIRVDVPHPRRREVAGDYIRHMGEEKSRRCREVWDGWTPVRRWVIPTKVGPWEEFRRRGASPW